MVSSFRKSGTSNPTITHVFTYTLVTHPRIHRGVTEVDNLQGVPPTGGEGETMVTP